LPTKYTNKLLKNLRKLEENVMGPLSSIAQHELRWSKFQFYYAIGLFFWGWLTDLKSTTISTLVRSPLVPTHSLY
jgi:hypothetical protein